MSNTVTIKFRAKRDEFAGGIGYKVPALDGYKHLSFAEMDTRARLTQSARSITSIGGYKIPGVIWEDNTPEQWRSDTSDWTITPVGKGFMADISITIPLVRN